MNSNKGVKLTEEHKRNIGLANKGKPAPNRNFWLGKKRSKETKEKISTTKTGSKLSTEHKRKIGLASKKCWGNPEYSKKMSESRLEHIVTKETAEKISKANKGKKRPIGFVAHNTFKKGFTPWNKNKKSLISPEEHHNWKGGITSEREKIRKSLENKIWIRAVFERDNFTCQKYGETHGGLNAHHIQNFSQYPEFRFAIDNGITLSKKAHEEFHKKYGYKNNSREQLLEFINS
jgi:hypothetical protein